MVRPIDLVRLGEFNKFIFYGVKKLPNTIIKTKYGEFNLGDINWDNVKQYNDTYDYGHALCQLVDKPNANVVAVLLEKICQVVYFVSENDKTLWVYTKVRE